MTERRADEATRDVEAWLKCYYMQDHIGEEFEGSISAVVPFGLFVALDDIHIEGLLHVSDLGADYFHYDEAGHVMVGERTGRRYRLADRVRIQVVRANLETNKIDFRLVDTRPQRGAAPLRAQGKAAGKQQRVAPMPAAKQVAPDPSIKPSRALPSAGRKPVASAKTAKAAKPLKAAKAAKATKSAKTSKTTRSASKKGTPRG